MLNYKILALNIFYKRELNKTYIKIDNNKIIVEITKLLIDLTGKNLENIEINFANFINSFRNIERFWKTY